MIASRGVWASAGQRGPALLRFASTLAPTGAALGLQFIVFAITARGLGIETFGDYSALLAIAAICVELVGLGGADLLVRAVSRDPGRFASYLGNMVLLAGATFPVAIAIGTGIAVEIMVSPIAPAYVAVALAGEILSARVAASVELAMVAHGHTTRAAFVRLASAVARLLAALVYFRTMHGLDGWIMAVLIQSLLLSSLLIAAMMRFYGTPHFALRREELGSGAAFALNQTARATQGNVDRVVLARLAESNVLGAYAAGSRLLVIGLFPLQVMTRLLYPSFFRHGNGGIRATRAYAIRCAPAMLAVGIFSAGSVMLVAQLVPALLGPAFAASRHAAVMLAMALPFIGLQYLAADALTGAGLQHLRAVVYAASAIGFGLMLALGGWLAGVAGLIASFLLCHGLLAALLWGLAWRVNDRPAAIPHE